MAEVEAELQTRSGVSIFPFLSMLKEPTLGSLKLGALWPARSADEALSDAAVLEEVDVAQQVAALQLAVNVAARGGGCGKGCRWRNGGWASRCAKAYRRCLWACCKACEAHDASRCRFDVGFGLVVRRRRQRAAWQPPKDAVG